MKLTITSNFSFCLKIVPFKILFINKSASCFPIKNLLFQNFLIASKNKDMQIQKLHFMILIKFFVININLQMLLKFFKSEQLILIVDKSALFVNLNLECIVLYIDRMFDAFIFDVY